MAEFIDLEKSSGGGSGGDADADGVSSRPPPHFPPETPFLDLENNPLPPPHPSLRGGHPPHPHPFSPSQLHVIASVSDTIFPSLPPPPLDAHGLPPSPDVHSFYRLSASDWDVPAHTAGLFAKVLRPIHLRATSLVLFLLATRLGTLLLCGGDAFVRRFPFLQPFPDLPQATRERILRKWATSAFFVFQVIFKVLKGTVVWCCFARADEHGYNPTWKAMGYYLPQHEAQPPPDAAGEERSSRKPLDGKVIDVQEERALCAKLIELGFWAVEGESHMQRLRRNPAAAAAASKMKRKKKRSAVSETGGGNYKDVTVKCDVVVVGSGSGGGVAAGVLARAGLKVVVIEKGGYYAREDFSHIEYSTGMELLEGPSSVNSVNAAVVIKAGTCVGGGSTVNWSAALPTPAHVLREWSEEHHLPLFGEQRYYEAMEAVCRRMKAGVGYKTESLQNRTLREGCRNLGIPVEDVACNAVGEHYCGWCECGCRSGAKQSTAETWLVDAVKAGAVILSGCYAEEVLLKVEAGKRKLKTASGVVAGGILRGEGKLYVEARYAVVAACGALQTPLLLKRSGLRNKNIGRNLHLHPCILAWGYRPGAAEEAPMFEGSIISACCKELGGHKKKDGYGALLQTPSALPGAFSFIAPWESGEQFKRMMQRYSRTCVVFTLTRDKTKGRVEEGEGGKIIVRYEMCKEDKETAMEALELGIRILAAAPGVVEVGTMSVHAEACRVENGAAAGGSAAARLEEYLNTVRSRGVRGLDFPIQSGHQMGTCRMGSSPSTSVVDPSCESWEAEGLFLADTSVFPTALGVNPMVTVQSIAFCTAHNILHWLRSTRKIPSS